MSLALNTRIQPLAVLALGLGFYCFAASAAFAGSDTDTFEVSATVVASCDVSANDLAFGSYDPVSATPLDGATTVSVTCTNGTPYDISLNQGVGAGATVAARRMTHSGDTLIYSLYSNSNHSSVWGQTDNVDRVEATGSGAAQVHDVYGRVPINQTSPAGAYTDTITVTVNY
ncbi:MAG: spore coat U domain-containing protein [Hyphomonadaceae bacterium]